MYILVHMSKTQVPDSTKAKDKILVYGITGMLGSRIHNLLSDKFKIIGPPHSLLNLTKKNQVIKNINDVIPNQIIFAAGITKVDYAQLHPQETFKLNTRVVEYIATRARKMGIPVHYISTDAVFDGKNCQRPYQENDRTNPRSVYGKSKLEGEQIVLNSSKNNSVIRTIMIYSANFPHRKDFARTAYESLKNKIPFAGIVDQKINPTFVDNLVFAISKILESKASGVYHIASTDSLTNYQFLVKVARVFNLDKKFIIKTRFEDFFKDKPAPRSKCSTLDTSKFIRKFGEGILKSNNQNLIEFKKQIGKLQNSPIDI